MPNKLRDFLASIGLVLFCLNYAASIQDLFKISRALSFFFENWNIYVQEIWRSISSYFGVPFWEPAAQPFAFLVTTIAIVSTSIPPSIQYFINYFDEFLAALDGNKSEKEIKGDLERVIYRYRMNEQTVDNALEGLVHLVFFGFIYSSFIVLASLANSFGSRWWEYLLSFICTALFYIVVLIYANRISEFISRIATLYFFDYDTYLTRVEKITSANMSARAVYSFHSIKYGEDWDKKTSEFVNLESFQDLVRRRVAGSNKMRISICIISVFLLYILNAFLLLLEQISLSIS